MDLKLERKPSEQKQKTRAQQQRVVVKKWIDAEGAVYINVGPGGNYEAHFQRWGNMRSQKLDSDTNFADLDRRIRNEYVD